MTFTLAQLRCARLVAECGSFSEAGRRCGLSQPSVSASISELEAAFGAPLFRRTTRRVELTAFGRALIPRISGILTDADNLLLEAQAALKPDRKLLRIAFSPLLDIRRLSALLEPYRRALPDGEIIFKECDVGGLEARLESEQIDIACGINIKTNRSRDRCVLYQDQLHYLPRGGGDENAPRSIEARDIAGQVFVLTVGTCGLAPATRALFADAGLKLREYAGQAMSYAAQQEWVDLGIGAALVPASRILGGAKRFAAIMIDKHPALLHYEAVWLRASAAQPHLKACFTTLRKTARKLAETGVWTQGETAAPTISAE